VLTDLECAAAAEAPCQLSGTNLFLLQAVSVDAKFAKPTAIPDGFTGQTLSVPRPVDGRLYVKLRDDPGVISVAVLDVPTPPARDAPPDSGTGATEAAPEAPAPGAPNAARPKAGPGATSM
jgi:hypothetical protein